ncbi:putative tyrosyl-DNA phosphodiesterase [Erysiphe neolycopersici]|uniref:Putative tyrosyl-DNA phosphodiesterase n=1 Tax=Erysiphe neolycopersici TaxID=212602 RepID=A0A420HKS7_9PEZI|nr:putative tyrosyl-DNA phosphodiesterase [Erysiphe neolycopersici]
MTQGLWRSPQLTKLNTNIPETSGNYGDGSRFKFDFINYLSAYDLKSRKKICEVLIKKLVKYDFSSIRAALVASVPGKHNTDPKSGTLWGWAGLQEILKTVMVKDISSKAEIITQVSSIATLGTTNTWLEKTFFKALKTVQDDGKHEIAEPEFKLIFPTADEIRRSLNGYDSGSAIHTKIHTSAQAKQLQYLKPLMCHWAGDGALQHDLISKIKFYDAGRKRAAPHIKTYIRFSDKKKETIDWILLTSANLSKQAWGESINATGKQRVCSYEIGVLVWPSLFGPCAKFVPTFQTDEPSTLNFSENYETLVGIRMPYDLPVISYHQDDEPWCASSTYNEPDWKGRFHVKN